MMHSGLMTLPGRRQSSLAGFAPGVAGATAGTRGVRDSIVWFGSDRGGEDQRVQEPEEAKDRRGE